MQTPKGQAREQGYAQLDRHIVYPGFMTWNHQSSSLAYVLHMSAYVPVAGDIGAIQVGSHGQPTLAREPRVNQVAWAN